MPLETLTVENIDEGYEYTMAVLQGVDESLSQPAFSLSVPGTSAANNILLGIQGQQGDIRIQFYVHNDGTDKANGTAPAGDFDNDTVVTMPEQDRWLREYIRTPGFDVEFSLTHDTGEYYNADDIYIEDINIPKLQQDSPKWVQAEMRVRRGGPI